MASSYSRRHMGHYKVIAKWANLDETIALILVNIINISIITSRPLQRWQQSVQVMLEKGKGHHAENLQIIQLYEADLNFVLNIIWGYHLIRNAQKQHQLETCQYALPGQTCHSTVWNKALYCDLMHQSISHGVMTDYDATAAFDWVLHTLSIITCHQLGLPHNACSFMFQLLQNMEFFLLTGFGISDTSFQNNEDQSQTGQGMLLGSSSAVPIYNISTDVSLATYNKLAHGGAFVHPITGEVLQDTATQYVDDKTEMINTRGLHTPVLTNSNDRQKHESIFKAGKHGHMVFSSLAI